MGTIRRQAGFTLLELLVAITLMGFLMVVLFAGFRIGSRSWDSTEDYMDENAQALALRGAMRELLSQSYPFVWPKSPEKLMAFSGSPSDLHMIAPIPGNRVLGGLRHVELRVDETDTGLRLLFRYGPVDYEGTEFSPLPEKGQLVLIEKAKEISISYFGVQEEAGQAGQANVVSQGSWTDQWGNGKRMPTLIRIHAESERGPQWPDMIVPLPASGPRCRWDDFYKRCMD